MSKEHIDMVGGVHNSVAIEAMRTIPKEVDFSPIDTALRKSHYHIMQSHLTAADGSVESAMHLHDSVRSLGKVLRAMSTHAPDSPHTLSAFKDLQVAVEMAARHEKDCFSGSN